MHHSIQPCRQLSFPVHITQAASMWLVEWSTHCLHLKVYCKLCCTCNYHILLLTYYKSVSVCKLWRKARSTAKTESWKYIQDQNFIEAMFTHRLRRYTDTALMKFQVQKQCSYIYAASFKLKIRIQQIHRDNELTTEELNNEFCVSYTHGANHTHTTFCHFYYTTIQYNHVDHQV